MKTVFLPALAASVVTLADPIGVRDNELGNYNPTFFANEALQVLYKALGMAARVHRGAEEERSGAGNNLGDTINLRRPSHFEAQDHVQGVGTDSQKLVGQNIQISLDAHKEVKFEITDRELAYTSERIIDEHIAPAAYALANKIDQVLFQLGARVGPKAKIAGAASSSFITGPRKVLRNNEVPMDAGMIHYLVDSGLEAAFLDMEIFHSADKTGQGNNTAALMNGSLGQRFGVETFTSQNADVDVAAMTSTATASAGAGDMIAAVNGAVEANVGTIVLGGLTDAQTLKIGDTFTVAGDPTTYILTSDATVAVGGGATVSFYPALRKPAENNAVVTFDVLDDVQEAAHVRNLMFHRNAFALAFAPLPRTGDGRGAQIETVTDPVTGLSVRARMYYDGDTSKNYVALDALFGSQVLNGQMAVRVNRAADVYPS